MPAPEPRAAAPAPAQAYVGTELDLFGAAMHWKRYWSGRVRAYLRGRVLDVGAGIGATARLFAGAPAVTAFVALEPDAQLAARMRAGLAEEVATAGVDVRVGTLASLPDGEHFDTILYIDVLEHIADDRGELAAAAARLAPGGRVVVLAPAHQWLYSPFDAAVGHERRYDRRSLRAALPAGLRVEALEYLDSVGLLASLGNRLLLRSPNPTPAQIALWDRAMVPVSRLLDPLLMRRVGKSLLLVAARQ